jgi:valyl-tRNA synthetase
VAIKDADLLVYKGIEAIIPMRALFDRKLAKQRLDKEIKNLKSIIVRHETKLQKQDFVDKAPAKVVDKVREQLTENQSKLDKLMEQLTKL